MTQQRFCLVASDPLGRDDRASESSERIRSGTNRSFGFGRLLAVREDAGPLSLAHCGQRCRIAIADLRDRAVDAVPRRRAARLPSRALSCRRHSIAVRRHRVAVRVTRSWRTGLRHLLLLRGSLPRRRRQIVHGSPGRFGNLPENRGLDGRRELLRRWLAILPLSIEGAQLCLAAARASMKVNRQQPARQPGELAVLARRDVSRGGKASLRCGGT